MKRLLAAIDLFIVGFKNPDLSNTQVVKALARLVLLGIKTHEQNKSFAQHIFFGDKRIVSYWTYSGVTKNPTDRITELAAENEAIKNIADISNEKLMKIEAIVNSNMDSIMKVENINCILQGL